MKMIILPLLLGLLLCGCAKPEMQIETEAPELTQSTGDMLDMYVENELLALVDGPEQAQQIAELYGIELVEYSDGLARYYTEEDLAQLIRLGEEKGWPKLHYNNIYRPD